MRPLSIWFVSGVLLPGSSYIDGLDSRLGTSNERGAQASWRRIGEQKSWKTHSPTPKHNHVTMCSKVGRNHYKVEWLYELVLRFVSE
eukprot:1420268-Amphidinium_carterae.1